MEIEELYGLMAEFRKSGLGKLEYKNGDCLVKLEMPQPAPVYNTVISPGQGAPMPAIQAQSAAAAGSNGPDGPPAVPAQTAGVPEGTFIKSPLVGTFYAAPGQGSAPYVSIGQKVSKGETVCIVEAMKMMNEVPAPCDCVIEDILKENAAAAGFGDALFRIREI